MNYYVSPFGKDTTAAAAQNPATPAGPKLQFVLNCMASGDTLIAKGGVYEEPLHKPDLNGFFPNGTASSPTIFKCYPGEIVWLMTIQNDPWSAIFEFDNNTSYITFDGINFDGYVPPEYRGFAHEYVPIKLNKSTHHIKIINGEAKNLPDGWFSSNSGDDNEISNFHIHEYFPCSSYNSGSTNCGQGTCWGYPFYWNGNRNKILNNHVYNFPSFGVHLYCSGPAYCNYPTDILVEGNNIHDFGHGDVNRGAGILAYNGSGTRIINNAVWNQAPWVEPIAVGPNATGTVQEGNTFVKPATPIPTPPPVVVNTTEVKTNRSWRMGPKRYSLTIDIKPTDTIIINGIKR